MNYGISVKGNQITITIHKELLDRDENEQLNNDIERMKKIVYRNLPKML